MQQPENIGSKDGDNSKLEFSPGDIKTGLFFGANSLLMRKIYTDSNRTLKTAQLFSRNC